MNALLNAPPPPIRPDTQTALQHLIEAFHGKSGVPGISASILVSGQHIWVGAGVGNTQTRTPIGKRSLFNLSGIQKLLVALVVLRKADDGTFDLNLPIAHYLPELRGENGDAILLKHLLSHTAGYQGENLADPDIIADHSWEEFVESFNRRPQLFTPGTVFDYSLSAYVLVARAIERVTGKTINGLIAELLTEPLGIQPRSNGSIVDGELVADHMFHPKLRGFVPAKPMNWCDFWLPSMLAPRLTLRDLSQVCAALISKHLSCDAKRMLLSPIVHLPGQAGSQAEEVPVSVNHGCGRYANGFYGMSASTHGQCTAVRFDADGQIVVSLGLAANAPVLRDALVNKLIEVLLCTLGAPLTTLTRTMRFNFELQELCGTYEGAKHFSFHVENEGNKLRIQRGHNPSLSEPNRKQAIELVQDEHKRLVLANNAPNISVGFFRDPSTAFPILMFGTRAFRKIR